MHEDDGMMGQYVIDNPANSIAETNNDVVSIYPNPVSDIININTTSIEKYSVEIFNMLGEKILSSANSSHHSQLNIENLETGLYFILVKTKNEIVTQKIIIR